MAESIFHQSFISRRYMLLCFTFIYYTWNMSICNMIRSFMVCRYVFRGYGSSSYMKVVGSRSRSQEQKAWNVIPQSSGLGESMTETAVTASPFQSFRARLGRADTYSWPAGRVCGLHIFRSADRP